MSVINSMLRNLDERGANTGHVRRNLDELPDEVRVIHAPAPRFRPMVLVVTLILVITAAAGVYFYMAPSSRMPAPVRVETAEAPITPPSRAVTPAAPAVAPPQPPDAADSRALSTDIETETYKSPPPKMAPVVVAKVENPAKLEKADKLDKPKPADSPAAMPSDFATKNIKEVKKSDVPRARLPKPLPPAVDVPAPVNPPMAESGKIVVQQTTVSPQDNLNNEVMRAIDLQNRGLYADAETSLRAVLDEDKNMVAARQALIVQFIRQQRDQDVRRLLQEGVALAPTQQLMVMQYARLLAGKNEWKAAAEVLAPASSALARDPEYRALNGAVLQRLGRFKPSVEEYQAALRIAPNIGAWWVGLALSLESDGRLAEAKEAYQQSRLRDALSPELAQFVESKLARLP